MKKDPYAPLRNLGGPTHWRSVEHKNGDPSVIDQLDVEFPNGLAPSEGVSRRDAMKLSGASLALGFLSACTRLRRPEDGILPFVRQPENVIPGVRLRYATAMQRSEGAIGLVVEAHEGRPTKIEGNPKHPSSLGAADIWAQSEVMRLYDPERARAPMKGSAAVSWGVWDAAAKELAGSLAASQGKGLAVLAENAVGPTGERLLSELTQKLPSAKVYRFDPLAPTHQIAGAELAYGPGVRAQVDLNAARVIFALESDFLVTGPEHLALANAFGQSRAVLAKEDLAKMKRLYVSEAAFTSTGANADHRIRHASAQQLDVLKALAEELASKHGVSLGELDAKVSGVSLPEGAKKIVAAAAKDLATHKGQALVLVGEGQPAAVHALGHAINAALGATGTVVKLTIGAPAGTDGIDALTAALSAGEIDTLLVLDGNPVYTAPGALEFGGVLSKAKTSIHVGVLSEETGAKTTWHLPGAHFLEAWGDAEAWDGTPSIVQPLIHPLHGARASISILAQLLDVADASDKALVEATWRGAGALLEATPSWRKALHDGVIDRKRASSEAPILAAAIGDALGQVPSIAPTQDKLELIPYFGHLLDGRLSNVAWLMELPDSMTKLCWDNAILMSPSLAKSLGIGSTPHANSYSSDVVEVSAEGRKISAPTFVLPGMAPFTVAIASGFGRGFGATAKGIGVDVNRLLAKKGTLTGVSVKRTGAAVKLCSTQDHFSVPGNPLKEMSFADMSKEAKGRDERKLGLHKRPLLRVLDAKEYAKDGAKKVEEGNAPEEWMQKNTPRTRPSQLIQMTKDIVYEGQQWGMVVDLASCIGCNACTVACISENNVPTVGREQVMLGREMHWIRIDRYFAGDVDDPVAMHQPVACGHCENAPCEPVCPVSATVHDEEGINSMAYNRCIGTRYCSNNCPYKVRRFNYLDFTHSGNFYVGSEEKERVKTLQLQRNPDVTVRYRGVMEKCTYCTQRIEEAKIEAKRDGNDRKALPDGAVTPACAQTCPTKAITFGNINDAKSKVAELKQSERNYEMLQELNIRPRTTYLARITNENEELT
ncbi:MAG: TAT-variant-translocated molybdopterin oxidoreductase [Deltaproteobacteria bacterium]|nr:TAT-variant-translocated molybdopterin oxidoreductase [Deltaproteobacteria bacterium]